MADFVETTIDVSTEASVKPTIEAERVPDFPALAKEFRGDPDFALWHDLSQRGDKALRRKLFMAARTFVPTARGHRASFKAACKPLHIKGDNIEGMAIRFLFGTTLDKHSVHDWSCVVKYWRECAPEQQDVEAAAERPLTELKTDYRKFKNGEPAKTPPPTNEGDGEPESIWKLVSDSLSGYEPNVVIYSNTADATASAKILVYLVRQFAHGEEQQYAVPLSEKGIREVVGLIKAAVKNTTTRCATWDDLPWHLAEAAE